MSGVCVKPKRLRAPIFRPQALHVAEGYQNRTRDALGQNAQWLSLKAEGTWKDNGVALRLPAIAIGAETSQMIPGSLDDGEPLRLRERISALRTQVRRCFWLWIAW